MEEDRPYLHKSEAGIVVSISDKADFRTRKITQDKEGHYVMISELILQEEITTLNTHAPNNTASKCMRQK